MINDINLIPKNSKNASKETMFIFTVAYLCLAVIIVFFGYFIPLHQRNQIKSKIAQKEEKLQQYADIKETYINLTDTLREMQNKVTYFEALKNSLKMSQVFDDLEANIPRNINIVNLSLAEGTLTINGVSPSYEEAAQYMVKLRKLDYVNDVSFTNAVLEDDEENSEELYDFSIDVYLNMPEISMDVQDESADDTEGEASENEAN